VKNVNQMMDRQGQTDRYDMSACVRVCVRVFVRVHVRVHERERERERVNLAEKLDF